MTYTTSKGELINHLFSKKRFRKAKSIIIQCDDCQHIPQKDILELYLFLSGVKSWVWIDHNQEETTASGILQNILNLTYAFLVYPFKYLSFSNQVNNLSKQPITETTLSSKKNLDVLYLRTDHWFNLKSGGSVGHVSGVVNAFFTLKHRIKIITTSPLAEIDNKIKPILLSPLYNGIRNIPEFPELAYSNTLFRYCTRHWSSLPTDFIYQRYSLGNYAGILLKTKYKIPLVLEYNGSFVWIADKWGGGKMIHRTLMTKTELLNLNQADLIVVVSEVSKEELVGRGIDSNKILVNPNGVDEKKYHPEVSGEEIRKKYELEGKNVLGFIGTFGHWHGVAELAQAVNYFFDTFPERRTDTRFLLIGDGKLMPKVKEIIANSIYEDLVILTGRVPQQVGANHLAACDIFLSPHIPNPDGSKFFGSPTKLFEYMAMGKPVIASDLDQLGSLLIHDETAYLVEPANIIALAIAMNELVKDKNKQAKLAQNALQLTLDNYTWTKHTKRIVDALKEVIQLK